jgi:hypothetical protein
MIKIINYPQDLKAAHELIDVLIAELNEQHTHAIEEEDERVIQVHSIPSPHDAIFHTSFAEIHGCNGGSQRDCATAEAGGVGFQTDCPRGVPSPSYRE